MTKTEAPAAMPPITALLNLNNNADQQGDKRIKPIIFAHADECWDVDASEGGSMVAL